MKSFCLTTMILILVGGCAAPEVEQASEVTPVEEVELDDEAWTAALLEERQEIDEEFRTSDTSPMAGTQYLKSEPGDEVYLALQEGEFHLADSAVSEAEVGVLKQGEAWHWQKLGQDVVCRVEGEEVENGSALEGPATFDIGDFHLSFYPSEDRVTFIVFDPERPEMQSFEQLLYFPPDRNYAVNARLVVHSEPETIEMPTTRNLIKTFYKYAAIEFELEGENQQLTALKSELTGEGSNGLLIEEPQTEEFVLDFNRAFNPLCNYSPAYNCTLPPRENHLEVAIRAGELTYPH